MKTKILISGGSGLVGKSLLEQFPEEKYELAILSRSSANDGVKTFVWDVGAGTIDANAMEFADWVIHLAGENIAAKPWSKAQKKRIIESRVASTQLLYKAILEAKSKPQKFLSASAVGFYGAINSETIFEENACAATDFLGTTTAIWESEVDKIKELGLNPIFLRIGVVLSPEGGALPKMLLPINYGLGAGIGSGKQYMPWIALEDLGRMMMYLLENETEFKVYNAVAPQHITNYEMMKTLAKSKGKPFFLPNVPAVFMKMMYGEMADILLYGSRVSSDRILSTGFKFNYSTLEDYVEVLKK
jgi:hypothetical protein